MSRLTKVLLYIVYCLFYLSCTNHDFDNPYDPGSSTNVTPPEGLTVSQGTYEYVRITWNKREDVKHYIIYRTELPRGVTGVIGRVDGKLTSYDDLEAQEGKFYLYAVDCLTNAGKLTGRGDQKSGYVKDHTAPDTIVHNYPINDTNFFTFEVTGTDNVTPGTDLEYSFKLDGGRWTDWSKETEITYGSLTNAGHRFYARTKDGSGNIDPTPCEVYFVVEERRKDKVTIFPIEDTVISKKYPDNNYSTSHTNSTSASSQNIQRCLLKFDLTTAIPKGSVIEDATLVLPAFSSRIGADAPPRYQEEVVQMGFIAEEWDCSTVTWNNQPRFKTVFAGGVFNKSNNNSEIEPMKLGSFPEYMQSYFDNPQDSYGIYIRLLGDDSISRRHKDENYLTLFSLDWGKLKYVPRLLVNYEYQRAVIPSL